MIHINEFQLQISNEQNSCTDSNDDADQHSDIDITSIIKSEKHLLHFDSVSKQIDDIIKDDNMFRHSIHINNLEHESKQISDDDDLHVHRNDNVFSSILSNAKLNVNIKGALEEILTQNNINSLPNSVQRIQLVSKDPKQQTSVYKIWDSNPSIGAYKIKECSCDLNYIFHVINDKDSLRCDKCRIWCCKIDAGYLALSEASLMNEGFKFECDACQKKFQEINNRPNVNISDCNKALKTATQIMYRIESNEHLRQQQITTRSKNLQANKSSQGMFTKFSSKFIALY